ncbi:MAG: sulfite exporter TauE/SafE family protein [Armatimonadetes bacterium]|nr:sulfite exporter TauE/SafE family protein [Armatimonadota bacterium]
MTVHEIGLIACILLAATLYSSVGHAGGSGYLAAMALFAVAPESMKPAALVLNVLVAVIATTRFVLAKAFSLRLFLPLAIASAPLAFVGGAWTLPGKWYKILVAIALVVASFRLAFTGKAKEKELVAPPWWQTVGLGAAIGLLSGLTAVGGGIYLTPVILFASWARPREASGVSAAFILVNSVAGLAGRWQTAQNLPPQLPHWAAAAVVGGLVGSHLGVRKFGALGLKRALSVVLVIAALKLAFA